MRLFIAIPLDDSIKDEIINWCKYFAESASGNFTRRENLHVTLEFLGETVPERIPVIRRAMDFAVGAPFSLKIGRQIGRFGSLWWLGIDSSPGLTDLQKRLHNALVRDHFKLDERPFRAHLTAAREVRPGPEFDEATLRNMLPPMVQHVSCITLFSSERIQGRLTYTPLYTAKLTDK